MHLGLQQLKSRELSSGIKKMCLGLYHLSLASSSKNFWRVQTFINRRLFITNMAWRVQTFIF